MTRRRAGAFSDRGVVTLGICLLSLLTWKVLTLSIDIWMVTTP